MLFFPRPEWRGRHTYDSLRLVDSLVIPPGFHRRIGGRRPMDTQVVLFSDLFSPEFGVVPIFFPPRLAPTGGQPAPSAKAKF